MLLDLHKKGAFGLDISDYSVEVVLLGGSIEAPVLLAMGRVLLSPGIIKDGKILKKEDFKNVFLSLLKNPDFGEIKTRRLLFSLPESKIFYHVFTIPDNLSEKQEKTLIEQKLTEALPFSRDEVYFDWKVRKKEKGSKEILIVASPKNIVNGFLEVFQDLNLQLLAIENEAESLARSLISEIKEVTLILDCGARVSHLSVFDEHGFKLSYSIAIGGNKFTQSLVEKFNLSFKEAEGLKKEAGLDPRFQEGRVFLILQRDAQGIIWEIRKIEDYFYQKEKRGIGKIILAGGSSSLPLLKDYLEQNLKKNVEIGDPWGKINIKILKKKEYYQKALKVNPILYATVIGSGLRGLLKTSETAGINLIRDRTA